MKGVLIVFIMSCAVLSCKTDSKDNSNIGVIETEPNVQLHDRVDGAVTIGGEFVYFADAAVLQTSTGMYGVVINAKMHELNDMAKQYKNEDTDFVPVTVLGKIKPKPEGSEGWDYNIEIIEILKVERPDPNKEDVIKIGTE